LLKSTHGKTHFDPKLVSNYVQKAKLHEKEQIHADGGEVRSIYLELQELSAKEEGWIHSFWSDENHRMARFFWMNPCQVSLLQVYGDVLSVDTSENRNLYGWPLTTIIVVDGENRSRNVAHCLSKQQDHDLFVWFFRHIRLVYQKNRASIKLGVIFSDRAAAIASAIMEIWPEVSHLLCLFHLMNNIRENLASVLGSSWSYFKQQFWRVYGMGSAETFYIAWEELLQTFPAAASYLRNNIFKDHQGWAWAFVGTKFCADMRTTGRVEVEHKHQKGIVGLGPTETLLRSFLRLNSRVEEQNERAADDRRRVLSVLLSC
jgi:MULE transposase domain